MVGREVPRAEIEPFSTDREETTGLLEKNKMKLTFLAVWVILVLPGRQKVRVIHNN